MTCRHNKLRFGCNVCRSKVKLYENNIDYRMDQLREITETLCKIYEIEELSDETANEIDKIIDKLRIIRYEVCHEADISQAQQCFSEIAHDFARNCGVINK